MIKIHKDDRYYAIKKVTLDSEKQAGLDALKTFETKQKGSRKRKTLLEYPDRKEAAQKNAKIRSIIDFDQEQTNSIKSLAV